MKITPTLQWIIGIVAFAVLAEIAAMLGILSSTYVHMQGPLLLLPPSYTEKTTPDTPPFHTHPTAVSQPDPSIPYKACIPVNVPPYFFAFWLPPLGYEFLVFSFACLKGFHTLRYSFNWGKGQVTFWSTGSRLLQVMIRFVGLHHT